MIVDTIKTITEDILSMSFQYGDKPSLNLYDGEDSGGYFLWLLPVESKNIIDSYNKTTSTEWDIAFFIAKKSDIDSESDYYNSKWGLSIKPIYDNGYIETFTSSFTCDGLFLSNVVVKEVINLFDWNMDGVYITATITEDKI